MAGVGCFHGAELDHAEEPNMPSSEQARSVLVRAFAASQNHQRPEEDGRSYCRTKEAPGRVLNDCREAILGDPMEQREKWLELCELATREHDPQRLVELTSEIVRLLDEKQKTIRAAARPQPSMS